MTRTDLKCSNYILHKAIKNHSKEPLKRMSLTEQTAINMKSFIHDPVLKSASGYVGTASSNKYWKEELYSPIKTNTFNHNILSSSNDENNSSDNSKYPFKVSTWIEDTSRNNLIIQEDIMEVDRPKDYFDLNSFDRLKKQQQQNSAVYMDDIRGAVGTGGESIPGLISSGEPSEKLISDEPNDPKANEEVPEELNGEKVTSTNSITDEQQPTETAKVQELEQDKMSVPSEEIAESNKEVVQPTESKEQSELPNEQQDIDMDVPA